MERSDVETSLKRLRFAPWLLTVAVICWFVALLVLGKDGRGTTVLAITAIGSLWSLGLVFIGRLQRAYRQILDR